MIEANERVQPGMEAGFQKGSESRSRRRIFLKIGARILQTIVLLILLTIFITVTMNLGVHGGIRAYADAIPEAFDLLVHNMPELFSSDSETVQQMWTVLPRSLGLLCLGLSVGVVGGVLLGGLAAVKRKSRVSVIIQTAAVLGISTPSYFAAMLLIWLIVWINQQTGVRLLSVFGYGWDEHLIMPAIVLASRPLANMTRLTYAALAEMFDADFVRTARSKGLHSRMIFWRHVLRNAGVPLLTTAGVSFRFSLAMLPVVEYIFAWPGLGLGLLQATQAGDIASVIVLVLPLAVLFAGVNILLELLYPLIDPRLLNSEAVFE